MRKLMLGRCWIDPALVPKTDGYVRVGVEGRQQYVHRVAYKNIVGEIPGGLELDHLCRNRACYNPQHLEPVTRLENLRRSHALVIACRCGHPYAGDNLYKRPDGWRECRTCRRAARERYRG